MIGAFDTPIRTGLAMHIFVADRGDYDDLADGVPQNQQEMSASEVDVRFAPRHARSTSDLDALLPFYRDGLGLSVLARFEDHDGFDGVVLGEPSAPYHFEFTRAHGHPAGRAPSHDNLLVLHEPDPDAWAAAVERMRVAGFAPVRSFNPWWDKQGATFELVGPGGVCQLVKGDRPRPAADHLLLHPRRSARPAGSPAQGDGQRHHRADALPGGRAQARRPPASEPILPEHC